MDETSENPKDLYIHDNVTIISSNVNDFQSLGTLKIVNYQNIGNFLEWRPLEVSIDSQDEWNVVFTKEKTKSSSPGSSSSSSNDANRSRPIKIKLSQIKSFKIKNRGKHLILTPKDGHIPINFIFLNENIEAFMHVLQNFVKYHRVKDTFIVLEEFKNEMQINSFVGLELENTSDYVWKMIHNFQSRPYETTLQAFSKLTDLFLNPSKSKDLRIMPEEVNEILSKSITGFEETSLPLSGEDYEMVNRVQNLPPRPECPRGSPLTLEQWESLKDEEGRITDPETAKKIIFRGGVSDSLRKEVWKYLLNYYDWKLTKKENEELREKRIEEYFIMKCQWETFSKSQEDRFALYRERKNLIEKDVTRTDRTNEYFAGENNPNLKILSDILMTYLMYNFDLGYVQGMSDLLSPVLSLINNEVDSFWCFVGLMERVKTNFDLDQAGMKKQLDQLYCLLKISDQQLLNYLVGHESENMFFCFRWLLILFKREFTYEDILYLWEVLFTDHLSTHFHLFVCLAILSTEKSNIIDNRFGFTEILKHINELSLDIDVHNTLATAESIFLQLLAINTPLPATIRITLGLKPLTSNDGDSPRKIFEDFLQLPASSSTHQENKTDTNDNKSSDNSSIEVINRLSQEESYEESVNLNYF